MTMKEFEMTDSQLEMILKASQPTVVMKIGDHQGPTPQQNANRAWEELGDEMGFESKSVRPSSKGDKFFTAIPKEIETAEPIKTNEAVRQALRDIRDTQAVLVSMSEAVEEIRYDTSKAVFETVYIEALKANIEIVERSFLLEHMFAPSLVATSSAVGQLGAAVNAIDHLSNTICMMKQLGQFDLEISLNYIRIGVEAFRVSEMIVYLTGLLNVEISRLT